MTSAELYAEAKRVVRVYLVGGRRLGHMTPSAVFYWRCRSAALLQRAMAARKFRCAG